MYNCDFIHDLLKTYNTFLENICPKILKRWFIILQVTKDIATVTLEGNYRPLDWKSLPQTNAASLYA